MNYNIIRISSSDLSVNIYETQMVNGYLEQQKARKRNEHSLHKKIHSVSSFVIIL